jgi:hypothetical protein
MKGWDAEQFISQSYQAEGQELEALVNLTWFEIKL